MFVWQTTVAFLTFIPLAMLVAWVFLREKKSRPALQFSSLEFAKNVSRGIRAHLRWLPMAFYIAALSMAIIALARPQRADTRIKKNVEGIDIMVVLDISDSMLIEDMKPNRLEASKQIIHDFIKKRVSDRIGLVVFSGESYTRVPLTLDYPLLLESVKQVQISRNIKMGTAIGVALANGVARLKDSTAKSRVLVFLTDGENNSGTIDPETALEIAKGYGIKIYSIGAGRDGDAQLPVESIDAFGRKVKRYQPIHSAVNDELLGKMASDTGGKYWRATDNAGLQRVFNEIDRLEKTKIETNEYTKYEELFPPYLKWAVWLAIAGFFFSQTIFRRLP